MVGHTHITNMEQYHEVIQMPIGLDASQDDATKPGNSGPALEQYEDHLSEVSEDALSEVSKDASADEATAKPKVAKAARRRQRAKRKEQQLLKVGVQKQDINPSMRNLGVKRRCQFRQQLNSRVHAAVTSRVKEALGLPSNPAGATGALGSRQ